MKAKELQGLSVAELQTKLLDQKQRLQNLKKGNALSSIENPLQIRSLRRDIARIATQLQKEVLSVKK